MTTRHAITTYTNTIYYFLTHAFCDTVNVVLETTSMLHSVPFMLWFQKYHNIAYSIKP